VALAALGLSVAPAAPAQAAAAEATFSVLTYNIAGLPAILSSAATNRETSTTTIGQRIKPYDIVNVQEDFNYHAHLYATPQSHGPRLGPASRHPYGYVVSESTMVTTVRRGLCGERGSPGTASTPAATGAALDL
jgi:hypothetical protein